MLAFSSSSSSRWSFRRVLLSALALSHVALGEQLLKTSGFTDCGSGGKGSDVTVKKVEISYNNDDKTVTFDVAGSSAKEQNVSATLHVKAYGNDIYSNSFNPCDSVTFIAQLCPVPAGDFAASGSQKIPAQYADMVPAIAFQVPDIAAQATLELKSLDTNESVACIESQVGNGKTADVPAVAYVAAGVAAAALVLAGASAASAALAGGGAALGGSSAGGGLGTMTPSFMETIGWFQGMAMNGMMSVSYPPVYRSFAKNFGFSVGIVPWDRLQSGIDDFRARTGGNLTNNNIEYLHNATLTYSDGSATDADGSGASHIKRALDSFAILLAREIKTSVNGTGSADLSELGSGQTPQLTVSGITAYAEQLSVPKSNIFMTALLAVGVIILAIVVGILLVKLILEAWALFGSFPQSLSGFRKHYWGSIARTITSLIMLLYGIWVLYCIFQFTNGDSIAAKALAAVTLAIFTGILAFFSWKIWSTARKFKNAEGDTSALYDDKETWVKYSLFYESYRKNYWWIFVPTIIYMFAKGCTLAFGDGHGMAQTIAQLIVEGVMLVLLLWSRPYERRSGNIINVIIQVVRVLSVVCILVFVEEFGIAETTQTITGVVLIAVQSALTGVLAILIAWNAINACCKKNPHRKRRKELGKLY